MKSVASQARIVGIKISPKQCTKWFDWLFKTCMWHFLADFLLIWLLLKKNYTNKQSNQSGTKMLLYCWPLPTQKINHLLWKKKNHLLQKSQNTLALFHASNNRYYKVHKHTNNILQFGSPEKEEISCSSNASKLAQLHSCEKIRNPVIQVIT